MSAQSVGDFVKQRRKALNMTQGDLALVAGTGLRFISDLENGKPTCALGKALSVLSSLGVELVFKPVGGQ